MDGGGGGGGKRHMPTQQIGFDPIILLCAQQKDVNMCAQQENWQCKWFACSRQGREWWFKNPISMVN